MAQIQLDEALFFGRETYNLPLVRRGAHDPWRNDVGRERTGQFPPSPAGAAAAASSGTRLLAAVMPKHLTWSSSADE